MNLKDFSNLVEIQSLQNSIKKHLDEITSQENRFEQLKDTRAKKIIESEDLNEEITQLKTTIQNGENTLYTIENRIEKAKKNQTVVTNVAQLNAINNELESFIPQKEELEMNLLEFMDQLGGLEQNEQDTLKFVEGSKKSIEGLGIEINKIISKENHEIDGYKERISNLISLLPPTAKELFINTNKKYEFKTPIVVIHDGVCSRCKFPIDRNLASTIEKGTLLELCPGCERILAPLSAQHLSS